MMTYKLLLFVALFIGVAAQLIMKKGIHSHSKVRLQWKRLHRDLVRLYFHPYVFLGLFLYVASFIIWIAGLSRVELSYAYPLVSSNFVLIAFFSKVFFNENVSKKRWTAIFVIISGVVLLALS